MVFYGYELPKKNNEIRLKNVSTSIVNANTRKINNINQQDQTLSLNMDSLTSTQTSSPSSIFTPAILTKGLQKTDKEEMYRNAITPTSTNTTPAFGRGKNLIDELKKKLAGTQLGLKKGLSKPEAEFKNKLNKMFEEITTNKRDNKVELREVLDEIVNQALQNLKIEKTPEEKKIAQELAQELAQQSIDDFMKKQQNESNISESEAPTELTGISLENAEKEIGDLKNIETIEKFYNWFMKNQKTFSPEGAKRAVNTKIPYEYDGKKKNG